MPKHDILYWIAPPLVAAGLVKNESWVAEHCREAFEMFSLDHVILHAGRFTTEQIAACSMAVSHPYALDYLRQAPILVLGPSALRNIRYTNGQVHAAAFFAGAINAKPKLRDLMALYRIPYPLRAAEPFGFSARALNVLGKLMTANQSKLAQSFPSNKDDPNLAREQHDWFDRQVAWHAVFERAGIPFTFTDWALQHLSGLYSFQAIDLADYVAANPTEFNERWSLDRVRRESKAWHERMGSMTFEQGFKEKNGVYYEEEIDTGLPHVLEVNGYRFVALRSGAALAEEGRVMHHCVGSYASYVIKKTCFIYSIRDRHNNRVATMEINTNDAKFPPLYDIVQVKGPANIAAQPSVRNAALDFIDRLNNEILRKVSEIMHPACDEDEEPRLPAAPHRISAQPDPR